MPSSSQSDSFKDELKKRCETLERQLSEVKAQTTIADLQKEKVANADEVYGLSTEKDLGS